MLFNSYEFILVFLPVVVAGFYLIGRFGRHRAALGWLVAAAAVVLAGLLLALNGNGGQPVRTVAGSQQATIEEPNAGAPAIPDWRPAPVRE